MAIASGKREADLTELVRNYQAGVWRYLRFLGADESLADDLTQETFLAVWKKPFVDHTPAATRQYLRTTARNLYLMSWRKRSREPNLDLIRPRPSTGHRPNFASPPPWPALGCSCEIPGSRKT